MLNTTLMLNTHIKLTQVKESIRSFVTSERGVAAIEYAVVAAGVAAVVIVIFKADGPVGEMLTTTFNTLKVRISGLLTPATP